MSVSYHGGDPVLAMDKELVQFQKFQCVKYWKKCDLCMADYHLFKAELILLGFVQGRNRKTLPNNSLSIIIIIPLVIRGVFIEHLILQHPWVVLLVLSTF